MDDNDDLMESYDCLEDVLDDLLAAADAVDHTHDLGGES